MTYILPLKSILLIMFKGMLTTHILTHHFQYTLFDWLKFIWVPPNYIGLI